MTKSESNKKRNILISIAVVLFGIFLVGGTYAFLILVLNVTNGSYTHGTECFDIFYDATNYDGTMDLVGSLEPTSTYEGGLSGQIELGMNDRCNVKGYGSLYFEVSGQKNALSLLTRNVKAHCEDVNTLETLTKYKTENDCSKQKDAKWVTDGTALKYVVTVEGEDEPVTVSVGYIKDTPKNILYNNFEVSDLTKYGIYIWLDGNLVDNSYADIALSGSILVEVSQGIQPEAPVLDSGMIPVKIANDGTVTTLSSDDDSWYNYDQKEWANVVLVNESSRSKYLNTSNVEVSQNDILAYYVWIPRYKYRINSMSSDLCSKLSNPTMLKYPQCYGTPYIISEEAKDKIQKSIENEEALAMGNGCRYSSDGTVDCSEVIDSLINILINGKALNYYIENYCDIEYFLTADEYSLTFYPNNYYRYPPIDISFENKKDFINKGNAVDTYYTHPAFWWDDDNDNIVDTNEMLAGIWVGKFSETYYNGVVANLPNKNPYLYTERNLYLYSYFVNSLSYSGGVLDGSKVRFSGNSVYGLTKNTDSHLIKNSEWGAISYLSHSKYGINGMVTSNKSYYESDDDTYYYGSSDFFLTGCGDAIVTDADLVCTQTYGGNDSGIYNQSTTGNITGVFDMEGYDVPQLVMANCNNTYESINETPSGFSVMPDRKYYDLYTSTDCNFDMCAGHALYETSGWYDSTNSFFEIDSDGIPYEAWFARRGLFSYSPFSHLFITETQKHPNSRTTLIIK